MGKGHGRGGDDSGWLISLALCPVGLTLLILGSVITPSDGMTPEIQTFLYLVSSQPKQMIENDSSRQ